jgi:hypothetical protein
VGLVTLLEIEQDVYRRLQKNVASPDAIVKARIDNFINDCYRELMREYGVELREESLTFTTESGRARYALAPAATQIINITDTTNRVKLHERSLSWVRQRDPSVPAQVTGTPWVYSVLNEAGIGQQPTVFTNGALRLISTDGADVGQVTLEYSMPNGGFQVVTTTLTGVLPAVVNAAVQQVFRMYMAAPPVGTVELFQAAPALTLARIPGGQVATGTLHSWVIQLWPTPNGAITYTVDFDRPRRALIAATDEPALPEEFHAMLVFGACRDECMVMDDSRVAYYSGKYENELGKLRGFLTRARGQNWIPKGRSRGWSDLGPNFPADSSGGYW